MAIRLEMNKTERILFCASKWWGDPDMPESMQYPTIEVSDEDGEKIDYPLTFICQINCEDIAPLDPDDRLPHEGMLYFFGAIDEYIGYESMTDECKGDWPKGRFVVKYAKSINFETFQSCILVDDDDQPLTEPELEITFSQCDDDASGIKMLGQPASSEVNDLHADYMNLLQLGNDSVTGLDFMDNEGLNVLMKATDLRFGNWKKILANLH